MDNAQRFPIALDSPLEVSSEHDLVPAQQPTLAYNQQSLVSGLLMNTIKYERDGVFCGKYLYDYNVRYTYKIEGSEFSGLEVSHPDPDNPKYNPTLIHPDDVSRNFYWYEEYQKYAVDISYPNTRRLFNLNFLAGFLKNNILKNALGNDLKVDRTNADGLHEDGTAGTFWDMVPSNDTYNQKVPDESDKYIITGTTNREQKPFRLTADVYGRRLEDHVESDTGLQDEWKDFIPTQYDASLTFGADKINCQVVHETRDQDNIAIAMPALLLNETGKEMFITNVSKANNTAVTRLDFDGTNRYVEVQNANANVTLGAGLGLSRVEQTRYNSGTINEYDQIFTVNLDRIDREPGREVHTTEGTVDLQITANEAVIAVDDASGSVSMYGDLGIWSAAPTDKLRSLTINTGVDQLTLSTTVKITGAGSGRPSLYGGTPSYWQGNKNTPYLDLEVETKAQRTVTIPASSVSITGVRDQPVDNWSCHGWKGAGEAAARGSIMPRIQAYMNRMNGTNLKTEMKNDQGGCGSKWGIRRYYINFSFDVPERQEVQPLVIGRSNMKLRLTCNDIESGDWTVTAKYGGTDPLIVAYDSIVMNEDLTSGTIKVGTRQPANTGGQTVSLGQQKASKDQDLGIVFNFVPIKVKYIEDIKFAQSRRNKLTVMQGDQPITMEVEVQPWDFAGTLTMGDGITIPNTVTNQTPPDFSDPPYIPEPPDSALVITNPVPPFDWNNVVVSLPDPPVIQTPDPPQPPAAVVPVYQGWTPVVPDPPLPWPTLDSFGQPPPGAVVPPSTITPPPLDPTPNPLPLPTASDLPFDWDDPIDKPDNWDDLDPSEQAAWIAQWQADWVANWQNQLVIALTNQWKLDWMQQIGVPTWQQQQQDAWVLQWQANWYAEWNVTHPIIPPADLPTDWASLNSTQRYAWWQTIYVPAWTEEWQNDWTEQWIANDPIASAAMQEYYRTIDQIIENTFASAQAAHEANWRAQEVQRLHDAWVARYIADYKASELAKWQAANLDVGWIHRQCIWITFRGLSYTEVTRKRYVIRLPHWRMPARSGNTTGTGWGTMSRGTTAQAYMTVERQGFVRTTGRLFDMQGELALNAMKEPTIGSDIKPVPGVWRLGYGNQRTNMNDNTSAYGAGYTNKTLLYDATRRRSWFRRGFIVSSNGQMINSTINNISGPQDEMIVKLNTPKTPGPNWLSVLTFNNGSFDFDSITSDPALFELSYDESYQRILQFADGQWAFTNESMTTVEQGLINLYTYYSGVDSIDPEVVSGLLTIIWYVYDGASQLRITRFIENSEALSSWSGLGSLTALIASYSGSSINVSDQPDVYRLVFRDSDKANFEFFPKGIYVRGNPYIRYLGYSVTYDPIIKTEIASAQINFDYQARNPAELVKGAAVTVYAQDFYGQYGRGYTIVEAHDPQTGLMEALQMANPDLDYAFITQQFDTELYTENMFYLDQTHILKCTTKAFTLLELIDEEWIIKKENSRSSVLGDDTEALKYGVTSAVETMPLLYKITSGVASINITLMPLDRFDEPDYFDNYVIRYQKTVNIPLVDATIMGFSSSRMGFIGTPPSSVYFVNTIGVTSTRAGNYVMIGMDYDKGINQWTACINASTSSRQYFVFNGYGQVGIDGTVTGSAVPMFAMNARSGISVIIRDKPSEEEGFKTSRAAFVSGQSLVFMDSNFNRGICVGAKIVGARFKLKSLPLRFSRHEVKNHRANSGNDPSMKMRMVAFPNFAFDYFVSTWAWATAIAGLAMNSWTTQYLLDESDVYYKVEQEDEVEGSPPNDMWFKLAIALLMNVAERAGEAASAAGQAYLDSRFQRIDKMGQGGGQGGMGAATGGSGGMSEGGSNNPGTTAGGESSSGGNAWASAFGEFMKKYGKEEEGGEGDNKNKVTGKMTDLERKWKTGQTISQAVYDDLKGRIMDVLNTQSGGNVAAAAIAAAKIGCSNLYSVGPNQNVWAGPGFTQIHFYESSRISGSHSWCRAAVGNGTLFVPRIPPIPIPYIGPVDINHEGTTGIHPITDYAPIFEPRIEIQPNFAVGSKHIVYSWPTLDVQDHDINQTQLAPIIRPEDVTLYESEYKTREYTREVLDFEQWNETELVIDNCSLVQGVDSYHSGEDTLKIPVLVDSGYANFATPNTFDYCVYPPSELYYTATAGQVTGVSIRDTLVLDGLPSNVVVKNNMPLIASPYTCIETVRTLTKDTIRPRVFSGDTLVFPMTGFNVIKGLQVLHGCDGYSNRIAKLVGVSAVDGEVINNVHTYVRNGPVKLSSMYPPTTYIGKFDAVPQLDTYLQPVDIFASWLHNIGLSKENLFGYRYALPVVHKSLGLLPAAVQTFAPYKAHVIDGITSITTDLRTTSSNNKSPEAHDFVIYGNPFRVNGEYIAKLTAASGTVALEDAVATLGLRYIGSTPQTAWFYTNITNGFYTFTMSNPTIGATSMDSAGNAFRFKDVETGTWDFVAQEVAFKALMDRDINERHDYYKDIVRVKEGFLGTIPPPDSHTVWPNGYFDLDSTAIGIAIRGRHRSQVALNVWHDYMFREQITSENVMYGVPGYDRFNNRVNDGIVINHGHWDKVKGDKLIDFYSHRNYDWDRFDRIYGFFIDEYKLCTSFIGLANNVDCMYEWEITFALTPFMRRLLRDKYTTVYLAAEMQSPGGGIYSPVTRLYLAEEHFGRTRIEGALETSTTKTSYYTFRFNARNGAGSMEKLYIWSDGPVAIKSPIDVLIAPITEQRTQPLITRVDVTGMKEL